MRLLFEIAFKGTAFNGWQRQKNTDNTVQQHVESALSRLYKRNIGVIACGRTDAGVHASQFYFHVDLEEDDPESLKYRLNRMVSKDILIKDIAEVDNGFHARFSARSRTYRYYFHRSKDPFLQGLSCLIEGELDFEIMAEALEMLTSYSDFRGFCKTPDRHPSTICKISGESKLIVNENASFLIEIKANRFLKSMMRIIAYRLIELAKGNLSMDVFKSYLDDRKVEPNYKAMYPDGLYLSRVEYD